MKTFYIFFMALICIPSFVNAEDRPWKELSDDTVLRKIFVEKSNLKDPFSVQFREVKVSDLLTPPKNGPTIIWCGEVNAKNSYGAYGGWNLFYAFESVLGTSVIIDEKIAHEGFLILWEPLCKGSGVKPFTQK